MNLNLDITVARGYKSSSQIARVITEYWVEKNSYCPSCGNEHLIKFKNNKPVADFFCSNCKAEYELKSKKDGLLLKIVDGAYETMIRRINSENNPSFLFLNYSAYNLQIENYLVIPKHFFYDEIIEKRKPLGINAKRAGWIGCNILLNNIPSYGRIFLIKNKTIEKKEDVISKWVKTSFLSSSNSENRTWALEILKIVGNIKERKFNLKQIYDYESYLKAKFPNNNFIKDKIRQQLQIIRNKGIIKFLGHGVYIKL